MFDERYGESNREAGMQPNSAMRSESCRLIPKRAYAVVAQLVEQLHGKEQVAGSIPANGLRLKI